MEFGKWCWRTFEQGIQREWLLTNGIGGFASSTVIGANTRRYHGLLVASLNPPVGRHLILSKIDENITAGSRSYDLYSFRTPGYTMKGYHYLQRVVIDPLPEFTYNIGDIFVDKKIAMVYGENTVVIVYRILNGQDGAVMKLTPLVNFRNYHHNTRKAYMQFEQETYLQGVVVRPKHVKVDINVYCGEGTFVAEKDNYFLGMEYPAEQERGLPSTEDHYIPGYFRIDVKPGEEKVITVIATIENELADTNGPGLVRKEEERIKNLVEMSGFKDDMARRLVAAADNFIAFRRSTGSKTIIAGYPWFTDWGRDAMIALPGLTLATGRTGDAREILRTFSMYVKDGLVPNMFPDEGQEPVYNTVDASLWYIEAVNKYLQYTNDYDFVFNALYRAMNDIADSYIHGTRYNIYMDEDSLIHAGEENSQLTWMDVKIGGTVVTPRHGKAVEINALWYNALKVISGLRGRLDENPEYYENLAGKVKSSFSVFWNEQKQCLYDVVNGNYRDDRVRPNQILAVSLSHPVVEGETAKKVVDRVWQDLYTAYGLRSLSPESQEYSGIYIGDQYRRDCAYHQGTVWTWPLGHFITAFTRIYGAGGGPGCIAGRFVKPFRDHLNDACVGSVSEIFDGDEPLIPRGCFAQAWSVGEIIRACSEAGLLV